MFFFQRGDGQIRFWSNCKRPSNLLYRQHSNNFACTTFKLEEKNPKILLFSRIVRDHTNTLIRALLPGTFTPNLYRPRHVLHFFVCVFFQRGDGQIRFWSNCKRPSNLLYRQHSNNFARTTFKLEEKKNPKILLLLENLKFINFLKP